MNLVIAIRYSKTYKKTRICNKVLWDEIGGKTRFTFHWANWEVVLPSLKSKWPHAYGQWSSFRFTVLRLMAKPGDCEIYHEHQIIKHLRLCFSEYRTRAGGRLDDSRNQRKISGALKNPKRQRKLECGVTVCLHLLSALEHWAQIECHSYFQTMLRSSDTYFESLWFKKIKKNKCQEGSLVDISCHADLAPLLLLTTQQELWNCYSWPTGTIRELFALQRKEKIWPRGRFFLSCFYQRTSVKAITDQMMKQPLSVSVSFTPGCHRIHPLLSSYSLFSKTSFIPRCHGSFFYVCLHSQSKRINYLEQNLVTS